MNRAWSNFPRLSPLLLAISGWLAAASCGAQGAGAPTSSMPPPSPRKVAVLLAADDAELERAVRAGRFFLWVAPNVPGLEATVGDAGEGADLRVEAVRLPVPPRVAALAAALPVRFLDGAFEVSGERYGLAEHALALHLPEARPATWLVVGRSSAALAALVDEVLLREAAGAGLRRRRSPPEPIDFLVRETDWVARSGRFRAREAGGYEIDPTTERDEIAARADARGKATAVVRGPIRLLVAADGPRGEFLDGLAAILAAAARKAAAGIPFAGDPSISIEIAGDHVEQARATGQVGVAVPALHTDLSLVALPEEVDAARFAVARRLLDRSGRFAGWPPALADGAALWLSRGWFGRDFSEWLPALAAAEAFPAAAELLAGEPIAAGSGPLAPPVAAAWIDGLPGATLAEKLRAGPPTEAALAARLAELAAAARRRAPELPRVGHPVRPPSFLRGVSFAMLNSVEGGYHAPSVGRELDRLAALGVDAIALMPFAAQRDPRSPDLRVLDRSPWSETDTGLFHAAREAHRRGLRVLWKPHVWVDGSWPGEVEMKSDEDWQRWFASYRRYLLHQAFDAAWVGADLFSIGVELDRTMVREAEWRRLIEAVRRLYPGPIVYAANWDRAGAVPIWDALDAVGVDAYFPLAASEAPSDRDLDRGARSVVATLAGIAASARRPLILTEVGFPARAAAWRDPHREDGKYSDVDQARAYRALLGALGRPPWLAGAFVWKSFSDEIPDPEPSADFRFLGRPAEGVIRGYFSSSP